MKELVYCNSVQFSYSGKLSILYAYMFIEYGYIKYLCFFKCILHSN